MERFLLEEILNSWLDKYPDLLRIHLFTAQEDGYTRLSLINRMPDGSDGSELMYIESDMLYVATEDPSNFMDCTEWADDFHVTGSKFEDVKDLWREVRATDYHDFVNYASQRDDYIGEIE